MARGSIDAASRAALWTLDAAVHAVASGDGWTLTVEPGKEPVVATAPAITAGHFGAASFRARHGVRAAYAAGAMAGGIGSVPLVVCMARAGLMAGFGAGGLDLAAVEQAVGDLTRTLGPEAPFEVNLLHAPAQPDLEMALVEVFLRHGVRRVSASGFTSLTPAVVRYRVSGLAAGVDGGVVTRHHLLAKVSRPEVAELFMRPAPEAMVTELLAAGLIEARQAALARRVPVAADVTAEGDSGGHTDRRASLPLLSSVLELARRVEAEHAYHDPIHIGSAGGIGTPSTALAAFVAGADYIMTGSINQACVEAGTSNLVKAMLARADVGSVEMAPAADMFELGGKVQVLKQGTLFASKASRLARLFASHDGLATLSPADRAWLEAQVFRRSTAAVWDDAARYLADHAPAELSRAVASERVRMAMVFRWYLGMSSRWAIAGQEDRKTDFQIWCGPAMAAFNHWARGGDLEAPQRRGVTAVAERLLDGAAAMYRARILAMQGIDLPFHTVLTSSHRPNRVEETP
jgi:trans-AT polyketide synthase/acyltransferase/oxidoreductase domain-containing protein